MKSFEQARIEVDRVIKGTQHKTASLRHMVGIVDAPSWKHFRQHWENEWYRCMHAHTHRTDSEPFRDGRMQGRIEVLEMILGFEDAAREEIARGAEKVQSAKEVRDRMDRFRLRPLTESQP